MKLFIGVLTSLLTCYTFVEAQVNFREISFRQALEYSKTEKKLIFLDCRTKWCSACKAMDRNVFSKQEVGDFFNAHFINVEMDMESEEGKMMQKKLKVNAYPTFFIINSEGDVQHCLVGGRAQDQFIALVRQGMVVETSLSHLDSLYRAGALPSGQQEMFVTQLKDASETARVREVAFAIYDRMSEADRAKGDYWYLYQNIDCFPTDAMFAYLIAHKARFAQLVGDSLVDLKIKDTYETILRGTSRATSQEIVTESMSVMKAQLAEIEFAGKQAIEVWRRHNEACQRKDTEVLLHIWENQLKELPFTVLVSIPFQFAYIVDSGDREMIRRYVRVGDQLLEDLEEGNLKTLVKEAFDKYRKSL